MCVFHTQVHDSHAESAIHAADHAFEAGAHLVLVCLIQFCRHFDDTAGPRALLVEFSGVLLRKKVCADGVARHLQYADAVTPVTRLKAQVQKFVLVEFARQVQFLRLRSKTVPAPALLILVHLVRVRQWDQPHQRPAAVDVSKCLAVPKAFAFHDLFEGIGRHVFVRPHRKGI